MTPCSLWPLIRRLHEKPLALTEGLFAYVLREFCEERGQGYVLRVRSTFRLTLAAGVTLTCAQVVTRLLKDTRRWEVRSAGTGSKGQRWYSWAWLATASPRHHLLIRRHLATGELAFQYCYVPGGQPVSKARLIRAAGLRWPVETILTSQVSVVAD